MPRPIITDRLTLRHYVPADAPRLARLIAAPDVQRWLPRVPHPYGENDAKTFIAGAKNDSWKLAITLQDELIGGIALVDELGYWLGTPYWGHGFASEAARAILTEWFSQNAGEVASGHRLGNVGSRNVLRKLGFRDTTQSTFDSFFEGGPITIQAMTLTQADWQVAA